jgi:SSS family solute:Na+ symporter
MIGRISVLLVGVVRLSRDPDSGFLALVSHAWAGFGAAFGPLVLCLTWPRANFEARIARKVWSPGR